MVSTSRLNRGEPSSEAEAQVLDGELGSHCFCFNWRTWPPGLLTALSVWPRLRAFSVPIHQGQPWGNGWQHQLSPSRSEIWRGRKCCCPVSALTPHAAPSERHHGYEKPPAPGFRHLGEHPGPGRWRRARQKAQTPRLVLISWVTVGRSCPSEPRCSCLLNETFLVGAGMAV